jgi:ribosome-binding ATPase
MKLSIGIVGLPNVGKSTLFKLITKQEVHIANYPFATIDPNVGVVTVPDERLAKLAKMSKSKKVVPAIVEFYDIAGLVKGANKGEGLGNQFLSHIREVSAVVEVLRCFSSDEIVHVENSVDPLRDLQIINEELILKDLETVEKRLKSLEGEARTGDKEAIKKFEVLQKVYEELAANRLVAKFKDEPIMRELQLLAAKPQVYLLNGKEEDVSDELKKAITDLGARFVVVDLANETDLAPLIRETYTLLSLMSFFTTGEDETRAWTVEVGAKAPQAAGVIHTDFEKKFIRAEVIHCDKLLEAGSWTAAKQKGWLRLEGKEYTVLDGDVMEIRHG